MKRILLILQVISFFICFKEAAGQTMMEHKLEKYKTKFEVPDNFKIIRNDDSAFIATDDVIKLYVYPRKGETYTLGELIAELKDIVAEKNITKDGGYKNIYDLNGYTGVMVNGYDNDIPVFLMLLADPDNLDISLFFWIVYRQDKIKIAKEILQSIVPD